MFGEVELKPADAETVESDPPPRGRHYYVVPVYAGSYADDVLLELRGRVTMMRVTGGPLDGTDARVRVPADVPPIYEFRGRKARAWRLEELPRETGVPASRECAPCGAAARAAGKVGYVCGCPR